LSSYSTVFWLSLFYFAQFQAEFIDRGLNLICSSIIVGENSIKCFKIKAGAQLIVFGGFEIESRLKFIKFGHCLYRYFLIGELFSRIVANLCVQTVN